MILNRNGNLTENDVDTVLDLARVGHGAAARPGGQDAILFTPQGGTIQAKTPGQARLVEAARQSDIVFAVGPAGTGKTYTAVALAVSALKSRQVKKIVLARPAVEAGESLGFLPGGLRDKVDPYLRPLYDALDDMIERDKLPSYIEREHRRDRAAGLHARPDAQHVVRHPGRGAERDDGPDEDVLDAPGRRPPRHRHRRRERRPTCPSRAQSGPGPGARDPGGRRRHLVHRLRPRRTWSATSWSRTSSPPTNARKTTELGPAREVPRVRGPPEPWPGRRRRPSATLTRPRMTYGDLEIHGAPRGALHRRPGQAVRARSPRATRRGRGRCSSRSPRSWSGRPRRRSWSTPGWGRGRRGAGRSS